MTYTLLTTADLIGTSGTVVLFVLLGLFGLMHSFRCTRDPRINPNFVTSYRWAAIVCLAIGFGTSDQLPWSDPSQQGLATVLKGISTFLILPAMIIIPVYALKGLAHSRNAEGDRLRGYRLVLASTLPFFLLGYGFYVKYGALKRERPAIDRLVFDDFNYQYQPPRGYVAVDNQKLVPNAQLMIVRSRPTIYFLTAAEHHHGQGLTAETRAAIAIARIKSLGAEIRDLREDRMTIDGVSGVRQRYVGRIGNRTFRYENWHGVHGDTGYMTTAWCEASAVTPTRWNAEVRSLTSGFRIIDRARKSKQEPVEEFASSDFAYRLELPDGWNAWPPASDVDRLEGADFAAIGPHYLHVFPVYVGNLGITANELDRALIPDGWWETVTHGPLPRQLRGQAYRHRDAAFREDNLDFEVTLRVVENGDYAYLFAEWTLAGVDFRPLDLGQVLFFEEREGPPQFTAEGRKLQAAFLQVVATNISDEKRYADAARVYGELTRLEPNADRAAKWVSHLLWAKESAQALAAFEELPEAVRQEGSVLAWEGYILMQAGQLERAHQLYLELFRSGYRNIEDFGYAVDVMLSLERKDEALTQIRSYRLSNPSLEIAALEARTLDRVGESDRAVEIYREALSRFPVTVDVANRAVDLLRRLERYSEAIELAKKCEKTHPEATGLIYRRGLAEYSLGWQQQARETFRELLRIDPAHEKSKEYVEYINGNLGQGGGESIRQPLVAVELPPTVAARLAKIETPTSAEETTYLHRATSFSVASPNLRSTFRMVTFIPNQRSVNEMSSVVFSFDPTIQRIFVNELRVLGPDGSVVSEGAVDDYYVLHGDEGATDDKELHLPVKGLAPGHTLVVSVTREWFSELDGIPFRHHHFSSSLPVLANLITIEGDVTQLGWDGLAPEKWEKGIYWWVEKPPVYYSEQYQWPAVDYLPNVAFGDRSRTWRAVGEEYLGKISDKLVVGERTQRTAKSVVDGLESDDEKIEALASYVQLNCVYKAIAFGTRGIIPEDSDRTLEQRYGDCKDQAVLLRGLLKSVGIDSQLVLASTSRDCVETLPTTNQFNHMILYVPSFRGGSFVDTTDTGLRLGTIPPVALGGRAVLKLGAEASELVVIPSYGPGTSEVEVNRSVSIEGTGLAVVETVKLFGLQSGSWRSYLRDIAPEKRSEALKTSFSSTAPIASLEVVSIENLDRNVDPLTIKFTYVLGDRVLPGDQSITARGCALWERYYLDFDAGPRRSPFEFRYPMKIRSTTRYESSRPVEEPFEVSFEGFRVQTAATAEGAKRTLTSITTVDAFRLLPEQYPELLRAVRSAEQAFEPILQADHP